MAEANARAASWKRTTKLLDWDDQAVTEKHDQ
jgi:hypothetical protein